jgi:hypothetical protein
MIPSDVASGLKVLTESSALRNDSVSQIQQLGKLRELQSQLPQFSPGQRISALIQRILPDGTFRALVAGRDVVLSLPQAGAAIDGKERSQLNATTPGAGRAGFAPPSGQAAANPAALAGFRAGDTLDLVVTQSGTRVTFAQLAQNALATAQGASQNSQTVLSQTGKLISFLLTGQPQTQAAPLAAGRPLLHAPPTHGAQLAPVLRQAVAQSGLFYESHQVKWLSGKVTLNQLLQEPQAQLSLTRSQATLTSSAPSGSLGSSPSSGVAFGLGVGEAEDATLPSTVSRASASGTAASGTTVAALTAQKAVLTEMAATQAMIREGLLEEGPEGPPTSPAALDLEGGEAAEGKASLRSQALPGEKAETPASGRAAGGLASPSSGQGGGLRQGMSEGMPLDEFQSAANAGSRAASGPNPTSIPDRLLPLVHQQLDALATQHYTWQAQAWPGQLIEWEIEHPDSDGSSAEQEAEGNWNTTLRLVLPRLGGIEARVHLNASGVAIRLIANEAEAAERLALHQSLLEEALAAVDVPVLGMAVEQRREPV